MKYHCSLSLFGLIDQVGIHSIIEICQANGFGLAFNPIDHIMKGHNTFHTIQDAPEILPGVLECIQSLGLSAEWSAQPDTSTPSRHNPVMLYHAPTGRVVHGWSDEMQPDDVIQTTDQTPQAREILDLWPNFRAVLDRRENAKLTIIKSAHEALAVAARPGRIFPGSAEAYLAARSQDATHRSPGRS